MNALLMLPDLFCHCCGMEDKIASDWSHSMEQGHRHRRPMTREPPSFGLFEGHDLMDEKA